MGRPLLLFWLATTGGVISVGIAWYELPRFAAGRTSPLEALVLLTSLATLAGTLLIAGRILYVLSGRRS